MLKVENLTVNYDEIKVLNNISYSFKLGNIYGLIGRNGAGKTTFLKTISRLNKNNTGEIYLGNKNLSKSDYLDLELSYVSDSPIYFNDMTVLEHMLLICKIKKYSSKKANTVSENLLEKLKLEQYRNSFPNKLSKGTLQRMSISLSLIRNEEVLLMDEPFNGLDPLQVNILEKTIVEERDKNKLIIISSHNLESLKEICNTYLILKDGCFIEISPENITKESISDIIEESYGE